MKLTIEHIAPFITHGLMVQVTSVDGTELLPLTAIHIKDGYEIAQASNTDYYFGDENDFMIKPIFRKLDLTVPIKIDGVERIPLIELAKIAYPNRNWKINMNVGEASDCDREGFFGFHSGDFYMSDNAGFVVDHIRNQLQLFQWLFKHKYDVFGLIDAGLALDADNLPTGNPYNN